ncbi:MAG: hypothetical protein R3344_11880 [Acidobacteriota bacterium]|nr:hypothetical protein [Acidobacteriota bacterium]
MPLAIDGDFFVVLSATSRAAELTVGFNHPQGAELPFRVGMRILDFPFDRVYLTNAAQPGETLTVAWGVAPGVNLEPSVAEAFSVAVPNDFVGGVTPPNLADVIVTVHPAIIQLAAHPLPTYRGVERIVHNRGPDTVYLGRLNGAPGAAGEHGIPLLSGQSLFLKTTAGLDAWVAAGGTGAIIGTWWTAIS